MPTFPIKYSTKLPPPTGPTVPGKLDTDTGAGRMWESVAQAGQGLSQVGGELMAFSQKIRDAEDAVNNSIGKRKQAEFLLAGEQAALAAPDDEAAFEARDKAIQDATSVANEYKSKRVRDSLAINLNNVLPRWKANIAVRRMEIKNKNIFDSGIVEAKQHELAGRPDEAAKVYMTLGLLYPADRKKLEQAAKDAPFNSVVAQAHLSTNTDYDGTLAKLEALKPKTKEQADQQRISISHVKARKEAAKVIEKETADQFVNSVFFKMYELRHATTEKKQEYVDSVLDDVKTAVVLAATPQQAKFILEELQNFVKGNPSKPDPSVQADMQLKVMSMGQDDPPEAFTALQKELRDNLTSLGIGTFSVLSNRLEKQKKAASEASTASIIMDVVAKIGITDRVGFNDYVMSEKNVAARAKMSPVDAVKQINGLGIIWKSKRTTARTELLPATTIKKHAGWLKSVDKDDTPEEMYDVMLKEVGIGWETDYPLLRRMFEANGPEWKAYMESVSPTPARIPTITNDAEYEALESGEEFIDPNGQKRRKP